MSATRFDHEAREVQKKLEDYQGIVPVADPQVQTLASVMTVPPEKVKLGLVLLLATLVEVASAFGITVVLLATSREIMLKIERRLGADFSEHAPANASAGLQAPSPLQPTSLPGSQGPATRAAPSPSRETMPEPQNGGGRSNGQPVALPNAAGEAHASKTANESHGEKLARPAPNGASRADNGRQVTGSWVMPNRRW